MPVTSEQDPAKNQLKIMKKDPAKIIVKHPAQMSESRSKSFKCVNLSVEV